MLNAGDVAKLLNKSVSTARRLMDSLGSTRLMDASPREIEKSKLEAYLTQRGIKVDWSVLGAKDQA